MHEMSNASSCVRNLVIVWLASLPYSGNGLARRLFESATDLETWSIFPEGGPHLRLEEVLRRRRGAANLLDEERVQRAQQLFDQIVTWQALLSIQSHVDVSTQWGQFL